MVEKPLIAPHTAADTILGAIDRETRILNDMRLQIYEDDGRSEKISDKTLWKRWAVPRNAKLIRAQLETLLGRRRVPPIREEPIRSDELILNDLISHEYSIPTDKQDEAALRGISVEIEIIAQMRLDMRTILKECESNLSPVPDETLADVWILHRKAELLKMELDNLLSHSQISADQIERMQLVTNAFSKEKEEAQKSVQMACKIIDTLMMAYAKTHNNKGQRDSEFEREMLLKYPKLDIHDQPTMHYLSVRLTLLRWMNALRLGMLQANNPDLLDNDMSSLVEQLGPAIFDNEKNRQPLVEIAEQWASRPREKRVESQKQRGEKDTRSMEATELLRCAIKPFGEGAAQQMEIEHWVAKGFVRVSSNNLKELWSVHRAMDELRIMLAAKVAAGKISEDEKIQIEKYLNPFPGREKKVAQIDFARRAIPKILISIAMSNSSDEYSEDYLASMTEILTEDNPSFLVEAQKLYPGLDINDPKALSILQARIVLAQMVSGAICDIHVLKPDYTVDPELRRLLMELQPLLYDHEEQLALLAFAAQIPKDSDQSEVKKKDVKKRKVPPRKGRQNRKKKK